MTRLTHVVTGHELVTDDASVDFWKAAGYADTAEPKPPAKKSAAKKSTSKSKK